MRAVALQRKATVNREGSVATADFGLPSPLGIAKPKVWGFKEFLLNRVLMQELFISALQAIKML